MFCKRCGAKMPDGQTVCQICGEVADQWADTQPGGYGQNPYQLDTQPGSYGQNPYQPNTQPGSYGQNPYQPNAYPGDYNQTAYQSNVQYGNYANPPLGMKWFKFIIYFQLFAAALFGFGGGCYVATGSQYDDKKELVYAAFDGLEALDITVGILSIALAVFALVTRFALARFKKVGPPMYLGMLAANIIVYIVYIAICESIVLSVTNEKELELSDSAISSLLTCIVMFFVNLVYFNKRKHMFVN